MTDNLVSAENLKKSTFPLSILFEQMRQQNISIKISDRIKNLSNTERLTLASFIKSYFFSVGYELSLSYMEQLDLLAIAKNGIQRFSEYIGKCCIRILRSNNTGLVELLCKSSNFTPDQISLKSLFVLAGVNQRTLLSSSKHLLLNSGTEVSITKFFNNIGVRSQVVSAVDGSFKKVYQYYCQQKNSVSFGYRNSVYLLLKNTDGMLQLQNESLGKEFILEDHTHHSEQRNFSYVATVNDIKEYLDGLRNITSPMHDISLNGFNHFISEIYFYDSPGVIAECLCLDFSKFNLSQANFNEVYFSGCNFTSSDLTGASFEKGIFSENILNKTIIHNTCFDKANLECSDLSLATIKGKNSFRNTRLCFTNLEGIVFDDTTNMEGADITGAYCMETDFNKANTNNITHLSCITAEVQAYPSKHVRLKIFDNDGTQQDIPFQPYLIDGRAQTNDIPSLFSTLFNDNSILKMSNPQLVNFNLLYKLAYGLYATNNSVDALECLNKIFLSLTKKNRQYACKYLMEILDSLHKSKSKKYVENNEYESVIATELNTFLFNIRDKSRGQIEEYASILAEDIFNHNKKYFSALMFSELNQGTVIYQSKEIAPNFVAMTHFSDRLTYKICHDILSSDDVKVRSRIYQLYLLTALKLRDGFHDAYNNKVKINDLQGAASIVMSLCHNTLANLTKIGVQLHKADHDKLSTLMDTFNPSGNFKGLRILTTTCSIPYLAQLSKDNLFATEGNSNFIERMIALGKMQRNISRQQITLRGFQSCEKILITTDLVSIIKTINLNMVNAFLLGGDSVSIENNNKRSSSSNSLISDVSFFTSSDRSGESKHQDKLINALKKGDLEYVNRLRSKYISFSRSNHEGLCPLVSSIYSLKLDVVNYVEEQLQAKALQEWKNIDIETLIVLLENQKPDLLPEKPTFAHLGNWYDKYKDTIWCSIYDQMVLEEMNCIRWVEYLSNWNDRGNVGGNRNFFHLIGRRVGIEQDISSKNELTFPSVAAHQNAVINIQKKLDVMIIYLKSIVEKLAVEAKKCGPECSGGGSKNCLYSKNISDMF